MRSGTPSSLCFLKCSSKLSIQGGHSQKTYRHLAFLAMKGSEGSLSPVSGRSRVQTGSSCRALPRAWFFSLPGRMNNFHFQCLSPECPLRDHLCTPQLEGALRKGKGPLSPQAAESESHADTQARATAARVARDWPGRTRSIRPLPLSPAAPQRHLSLEVAVTVRSVHPTADEGRGGPQLHLLAGERPPGFNPGAAGPSRPLPQIAFASLPDGPPVQQLCLRRAPATSPPEYPAALGDASAVFLDHHQGLTFSYCEDPCNQLWQTSYCREGWPDQPVRYAWALRLSTQGSGSVCFENS